jgi:hypothetical protein
MNEIVRVDSVYIPSEDVVARVIEGELILVPLTAVPKENEGELYSLNPTGRAIWNLLDGKNTVSVVAEKLAAEYETTPDALLPDILGLLTELLNRRIVRAV